MSARSELTGLNRRQALVHLGTLAGLGAALCLGLGDAALAFPQVIVVANEDVTLTPQNPMEFTSGQAVQATYGTMTLAPGGYIVAVSTPLNLRADTLVKIS